MDSLIYFIVFSFGLIIGSFLNCVIYRISRGESFISGRSYCPNCKHVLAWPDLIPLFSFLALGGRCRYCKKKISWQYPLVELATAFLFVLLFWKLGFAWPLGFGIWEFLYLLIISCFLIIIFVSDLKTYIIPDGAVYPAIALCLIFNFQFLISNQFIIFKFSILSAMGAMLFFLLIYLVSGGKWMGFGDVKLAFLMGLFLGWPNVAIALFLAFFLGAIIGTGLIIFGRKKMRSQVPFGPFLVLGTFLALFFGQGIFYWYINLLGV